MCVQCRSTKKPVDPIIKKDKKTKKVKRARPSDDIDDVFMAEDKTVEDLEDLSDLNELVRKSLPGQQFYVPKGRNNVFQYEYGSISFFRVYIRQK